MRDDPQSILSTSRVQAEACAMLSKRAVRGDDEPWDVEVSRLWSLKREDHLVVHVIKVNKESALTLIAEAAGHHLVVIHNECTPAANKLLRATDDVEVWSVKDLCVNPFHFSFLIDAGIEQRPHNKDAEKHPKMLFDDPVRRYLGAKLGDLVWTEIVWGSLGIGRTVRFVV